MADAGRPERQHRGLSSSTPELDNNTGPRRPKGRVAQNIAAVETLRRLDQENREPTPDERATLQNWRSWGATPNVFKRTTRDGDTVHDLLTPTEWAAARRTTINAHYTDPELVNAIWDAVRATGFDTGRILEPGCGSGLFFTHAPRDAELIGIELDPISAQVAQTLHPTADIRTESFADTTFPPGSFDLAIGNVPFGQHRLYDTTHNPGRSHNIHNHFLIKSTDLVREGGIIAALTSRFTMDTQDPTAREALYQQADLITAIRLPTDAHKNFAGTSAVTDLLILRKRRANEQPGPNTWIETRPHPDLPIELHTNTWWINNPHLVLGTATTGRGLYGNNELIITAPAGQNLAAELTTAATTAITASPHRHTSRTHPLPELPQSQPVARMGDQQRFAGHISQQPDGTFVEYTGHGTTTPLDVSTKERAELAALITLRDHTLDVLTHEAATPHNTPELNTARTRLADAYNTYVTDYGPLNRVTVTTTKRRDKNGNPVITRRRPKACKTFRTDPHAPTVWALEHFDELAGTATPADILTHRVIQPTPTITHADTPHEALALSLDRHGTIRLDTIADLLAIDEPTARTRLGDLVYTDPATDTLVPAAQYLSGNVRDKLAIAEKAAQTNPDYTVNVDALQAVIPRDLTSSEIIPGLGAPWIPQDILQQFLREGLGDTRGTITHLGGTEWSVKHPDAFSHATTSQWGTKKKCAGVILEKLCRQQKITVNVDDPDSTDIDIVATEAANAKAEEIREYFQAWCWANPEREERLCRIYNGTFNGFVPRTYDAEGATLTFPGLAADFTPRDHQRASVARMIAEPSVGLYHSVGAGKTATMVMGVTELKRLGLVSKPCVVVPNHMLEQFTREWLQLYPSAQVLAASSADTTKPEARRQFVARAATGNWDAILMTHNAFKGIPTGQGIRDEYCASISTDFREQLDNAVTSDTDPLTVKSAEKAMIAKEEGLKKELEKATQDPGLVWESLGVDYLAIDELHMFKNLSIDSRITELSKSGSYFARDLDLKLFALRSQRPPGAHVICGATATPIANSLSEAWVMQHYLRPDILKRANMHNFDSWAACFAQTRTSVELKPAGDGFRSVTRFAQFQNLPEMLHMWNASADVRTAKDLNVPVPLLALNASGERAPQIVSVPMTSDQHTVQQSLAERANACSGQQPRAGQDNLLVVTSDGRKAALDTRLLSGPRIPDLPSIPDGTIRKVESVADTIADVWRNTKDNTYPGSNRPGGLQIVFCDIGTPSSSNDWNAYDEITTLLTERGMDPTRITYIHNAPNDTAKARLFHGCRTGQFDVIIGSTEKMGVGTNIQTRAVALHHIDCTWRPADIAQREGRIIRQGNQNPEVKIFRHVTEGSFDGYMWQTVARKAHFIDQVMHANVADRVAADIATQDTVDLAQITAIASGNPLLLQHAEATAEATRLKRLLTAHEAEQRTLVSQLDNTKDLIERLSHDRDAIQTMVNRHTTNTEFTATTPHGETFTRRTDAGDHLCTVANAAISRSTVTRTPTTAAALTLAGHPISVTASPNTGQHTRHTLQFHIADAPRHRFSIQLPNTELNPVGTLKRLENLVAKVPSSIGEITDNINHLTTQRDSQAASIGKPFDKATELQQALARVEKIETEMGHPTKNKTSTTTHEPAPAPTPETPTRPTTTPTSNPITPDDIPLNLPPHRQPHRQQTSQPSNTHER